MAKRRLHGVTQKRRKKKSTQALKRQESVVRVQTTRQPLPFQRSGELEPGDIAFLEAMRDMGVTRFRQEGESPARQENFERVRFATQREQGHLFGRVMSKLGVKPLKQKGRPAGPRPAERSAAAGPAPHPATSGGAAGAVKTGAGEPGTWERPAESGGQNPRNLAGDPTAPTESAPAPSHSQHPSGGSGKAAAKDGAPVPSTRFEWGEGDAGLMAATLRDGDFDPGEKYEGAPKRPKPAPEPRELGEGEPDGELDLHGKTQEEAIRMVQNFLLTSHRQKLRDVLIITGKGLNSGEGGPVLREAVKNWLERNGDRFAESFGWAPARHGGDGAIWVTLRRLP